MVRIPEGPFLRGSPPEIGLADEHPQRTIYLSEFEIDELPVTFAEFTEFIEAGGYRRPEFWSVPGWEFRSSADLVGPRFLGEPQWSHLTGPRQPVCGVSFWEAEAYARFLGKRLPTEAQWEKAARGADGRPDPRGAQRGPRR